MEMNTQQTREYLKTVSELEVSVYRQEQTLEGAWENLVLREVPKPNLEEPKKSVTTFKSLEEMTKEGDCKSVLLQLDGIVQKLMIPVTNFHLPAKTLRQLFGKCSPQV